MVSDFLIKTVIEEVDDCILLIDPSSAGIIYANTAAVKRTGYSLNELSELSIFNLNSLVTDDQKWQYYKQQVFTLGKILLNTSIIAKNGEVYPAEINIKHINFNGEHYFACIARDYSKQKDLFLRLEASKDFYQALTELAIVGIGILDVNGVIKYYNHATELIMGYGPNEMLGKYIQEVMHPDDIAPVLQNISTLVETEQTQFSIIYRCRHKNGTWRILESSSRALLNNPFVQGILVTFVDVTEREELQQALRDDEHFLRNLVKELPIPVWVKDWNGKYVLVNDHFCEIRGCSASEILGKKDDEFGQQAPLYTTDEEIRLLLINNEPSEMVLTPVPANSTDKTRWFYHKKVPLITQKKRAVLGIGLEVTDLVKAEQDLEERNISLTKTNEELDRLLYSLSHELRSPLTTLIGLLNLAMAEDTSESLQEMHYKMCDTVLRMEKLLNGIYITGRNNRTDVNIQPIDFNKIFSQAKNQLLKYASEKPLNISYNVNQESAFYSDAWRISVIITTLLFNAADFFDENKNENQIHFAAEVNNGCAIITVRDNGLGIPKNLQHKIFNMFYRASEKSVGSGLGLYIVKETVDKLCGSVNFTSDTGAGSTFTITLPALQ